MITVIFRWPGGDLDRRPVTGDIVRVGRHPANDIVLDFPAVSGRHLQISVAATPAEILDLGSTNGTLLNGERLEPQVARPFLPGDVARIGDFTGNSVAVSIDRADVTSSAHLRPAGEASLSDSGAVVIGREPGCALQLNHPNVSRRHAQIAVRDGRHELRDLGSSNGTFVNGRRVTRPVALNVGDLIQVGPYSLAFDPARQGIQTMVARGHRFDALDLGVEVADGRMILEEVTLCVEAGEFVALVGGSGAGKSTLMKALNGYNRATHGRMLIDGRDLYPVLDTYRTEMGFVPQDDIIHRELPVRRALWYAARLRLPDATPVEIEARIDDALAMVEMTGHAEKPVRVLSGGQRKRVSIAVELLAQPTVLFLDEPTSGLDPGLEKKMMYDLNRLTDSGRTVVLVTHATGNIEQCHQVAFLSQGRLAYYGPPNQATGFFGARDFSDIYLKLSGESAAADAIPTELEPAFRSLSARGRSPSPQDVGELWAERYRESEYFEKFVRLRQRSITAGAIESADAGPGPSEVTHDSLLRQLWILMIRQFDLMWNDPFMMIVLLLVVPVVTALFAAVSEPDDFVGWRMDVDQVREVLRFQLRGAPVDSTANYIPQPIAAKLCTMLCLIIAQAGTFGAAYLIVHERAIFKRERAVNLKVGSYVLSKALVLTLFGVLQAASALYVLSLRVELPSDPILSQLSSASVELFITLMLTMVASVMFGLFISAVAPSAEGVVYILLLQLFIQMVGSGTLFPIPDNPMTQLTVSRWSVNAIGSTAGLIELNEQSQGCRVVEVPGGGGSDISCHNTPVSREDMALGYSHTPAHLMRLWTALMVHAIFWYLLTVVVQARKKIA